MIKIKSEARCGLCKKSGHNRRTCTEIVPQVSPVVVLQTTPVVVPVIDSGEPVQKRAKLDTSVVVSTVADTSVIDLTTLDPLESDNSQLKDLCSVQSFDNECPICLDLLENDTVNETSCKHKFHQLCLWSWLMVNPICPLCNNILGTNELSLV